MREQISKFVSQHSLENISNPAVKDQIASDLAILASLFSEHLDIPEETNILNILKKIVVPYEDGAFSLMPDLEDALLFSEPTKALPFFEKSTDNVASRVSVISRERSIKLITNPNSFSLTRNELVRICKNYIDYLLVNKKEILEIGFPKNRFRENMWIDSLFSNIYPIKLPEQIFSSELLDSLDKSNPELVEKRGADIFSPYQYRWAAESPLLNPDEEFFDGQSQAETSSVDYKDAAYLPMATKESIEAIVRLRVKIFQVKLDLLGVILDTFKEILFNAHDLVENLFKAINNNLAVDDLKQLSRIDEELYGLGVCDYLKWLYHPMRIWNKKCNLVKHTKTYNKLLPLYSAINRELQSRYISPNKKLIEDKNYYDYFKEDYIADYLGGITSINAFIDNVLELVTSRLRGPVRAKLFLSFHRHDAVQSYYQFIGHPEIDSFDEAVDKFAKGWPLRKDKMNGLFEVINVKKQPKVESENTEIVNFNMTAKDMGISEKDEKIITTYLRGLLKTHAPRLAQMYGSSEDAFDFMIKPRYIFKQDGKWCHIAYKREDATNMKYSKGAEYIRFLLGNPKEYFFSDNLFSLAQSRGASKDSKESFDGDNERDEETGKKILTTHGSINVKNALSKDKIEELKRMISEVDGRIKYYKENQMIGEAQEAEEQRDKYEDILKQNKGFRGRQKITKIEDHRTGISKALDRAYDQIEASIRPLAAHFRVAILREQSGFCYSPEENIKWEI